MALLCLVGTYSVNNSLLDLWLLVGLGVLGYLLRKLGFEPALVILALVLGPMIEKTLRQTLFMARGDWGSILARPLTAALLGLGLLVLVLPLLAAGFRRLAARPVQGSPG